MHCRKLNRMLPDYASGGLSAADAAEVSRHVAQCSSCADEAERYRRLFATALKREVPEQSVDWASLGVRMNERIDAPVRSKPLYTRPAFAVAAGIVLLVGILSVVFLNALRSPSELDDPLFSDIEQRLGTELVQSLGYEAIDEVTLFSSRDASSTILDSDLDALDETATVAIDNLLAAELDAHAVSDAHSEYLEESEALDALSKTEADDIFTELESKTFFND